jgi:Tfp pilus assembly protein PilN
MIKVNLLKDLTSHAHKKSSSAGMGMAMPAVSQFGIIWIVVAVIVASALAFYWFGLNKKIEAAQENQVRLNQEAERLKGLSLELAEFEKLNSQLEQRIATIEKLKESRKGPVSLLNAVIQSIPLGGNLWLTLMEQKEGVIKVLGETRTPEVLPSLMNNLTGSGLFASVDIEVIERTDDISKFSIVCAGKQ